MTETTETSNERGESFAELFEKGPAAIKEGEVSRGVVLSIDEDYVQVDIGFKSEGLVPAWEFMTDDGEMTVKVGDTVDVLVEVSEDAEGRVVLSKEKAERLKIWDEISNAYENDQSVEGTIISRVKGGLSVDIGVKAFLPGSQVDLRPVRNLEGLIGERTNFKIIKFNKRRGNIVLSRRALLETERRRLRESTLETLSTGQIVDGVIKNLTDYGAFIDLGGIDGLLHVTDMSWGRVNHPSELFQVGDEIKVKVLKFDPESERVSLGLKQIQPDPWIDASMRYSIGKRVKGKVVSLAEYGAFVELEPGIEGLIHVSEMSWTKRIKHPSKVLSVGDTAEAVVLDVDERERKISLGMKQIEPNPWSVIEQTYPVGTRVRGTIRNITNFGIFVGLDEGIDGLVHVSDVSWTEQIKHPGEKFKKGDVVEAVVLKIDKENEKFSLGIKQLEPNPWDEILKRYPVGSEVTGTVSSLADFGAFVKLEDGIEGLIYNSDLSADKVENASEVVQPGQSVKALVVRVDPVEQKISLSIRALGDREQRETLKKVAAQAAQSQTTTLGDILAGKLGRKTE
jgi:small subunit ribosomal protein S1